MRLAVAYRFMKPTTHGRPVRAATSARACAAAAVAAGGFSMNTARPRSSAAAPMRACTAGPTAKLLRALADELEL